MFVRRLDAVTDDVSKELRIIVEPVREDVPKELATMEDAVREESCTVLA